MKTQTKSVQQIEQSVRFSFGFQNSLVIASPFNAPLCIIIIGIRRIQSLPQSIGFKWY
jgi:hypothetical protein